MTCLSSIIPRSRTASRISRDRETPVVQFRRLVEDVGTFLAYEATRSLRLVAATVQTPLQAATVNRVASRRSSHRSCAPASVCCLVFSRALMTPKSRTWVSIAIRPPLEPVPYYANMPHRLDGRDVFVLDPMLATGNSGAAALGLLETHGATSITFVCLIAAPEGIATADRFSPLRSHRHRGDRRPPQLTRLHRSRSRRCG